METPTQSEDEPEMGQGEVTVETHPVEETEASPGGGMEPSPGKDKAPE